MIVTSTKMLKLVLLLIQPILMLFNLLGVFQKYSLWIQILSNLQRKLFLAKILMTVLVHHQALIVMTVIPGSGQLAIIKAINLILSLVQKQTEKIHLRQWISLKLLKN